MAQIRVGRETLARMLRSHGEDDLAERALSVSDAELIRIRELGAYYAFSEYALSFHGSMGGARALCLATIDVLESVSRDLRWTRTEAERDHGWSDKLSDDELARDRALRALSKQHPPPDA
jgi:hypothetical protein